VAAVPVGFNPNEVVVDEANQRAYVSNTGSDDISVIDLNLRQEIVRISVNTTGETQEDTGNADDGDQPFAMALANLGGTNFLYVAHFETNLITIINVDTLQIVNTFPPQ
jgi:YVTN family beta-propeller protein